MPKIVNSSMKLLKNLRVIKIICDQKEQNGEKIYFNKRINKN